MDWRLGLAVLALAGTGCSMRDCGDDAKYLALMENDTRVVIPDGVSVAAASPLYSIPEGGRGEVVLTREVTPPGGDVRSACIYEPPPLPVSAEDTDAG